MKLKGSMKIELTDVNTGEVTTVEHDNMMTDAVSNVLGLNLLGTLYYFGSTYSNSLNGWMTNLLPICPNLIGGILLFPNTLTEDSGNIYPTSENLPVAYASNDVNSSTDLQRGSLSQTEGGATDDGYQFVWEFTNTQGNGTIAAVALTSALGGVGGYGSIADDSSAFLLMSALNQSLDDDITQLLFNAVEVDFENDTVVSIAFSSSAVTITKFRIPILSIGLKEKIDDSTATVLETKTITCTTFLPSSTYHTFVDGHDGYWYGFGNSANSSGSATLLWIKISKTDYTYTEASFTLSNATMTYAGYRSYSSYPSYRNKCVVRAGYVYIPSYDAAGVYKINLENSADVTLISLGFTSAGYSLSGGSYGLFLDRIEDLIIGYDFQIKADDTVIQTVGSKRFEYSGTPMFRYKNFLLYWGGEYSITKRYLALLTPYLATINNLDTAVVKTSDMTMKITYTLTEAV
ncbi:MAG: hypothetical protein LUG27_12035 [Clostridiales bacterium]|nr:hypothetical protein [Clostridiales bacterium]